MTQRYASGAEERADRELVDALSAMDFRAPSLGLVWSPTKAATDIHRPMSWLGAPSRLGWRAGIVVLALALTTTGAVMAAVGAFPIPFELNQRFGCPDPDTCGPSYEVTSRSHSAIASPYNVEAFNVVVAPGTSRERITAVANEFAARHKGGRTVVYFFTNSSGQERYAGARPSTMDAAADPAPTPAVVDGWLALFDFAPSGATIVRWGPGG
jgi:hypothetical protein